MIALAVAAVSACGTAPPSSVTPSAIAEVAPTLAPMPATSISPMATSRPSPSPSAASTSDWLWTGIVNEQFGGMSLAGATRLRDRCLLAFSSDRPVAMWESADGRTWWRQPDSPAFAPPRRRWTVGVGSVADTPFGIIAVGSEGDQGDTTTERAAAWFSRDGRTWKRAKVTGAADRSMDTIVVTKHGLVALGLEIYDPPWYGSDQDGTAVWTSTDGRAWHHVAPRDAVPLGVRVFDVSRLGRQFYGLAYSVGERTTSRSLGLWTSSDAVSWQRARHVPKHIYSIASTGRLLVANADLRAPGRPTRAVSWLTTDGRSWTKARQAKGPAAPAGGFLVAGRDAVFTVGGDENGETLEGYDQVWELVDGSWLAIEPARSFIDNAYAYEGFTAGRSLVLVTDQMPDPGAPPTTWLLEPPQSAARPSGSAGGCDVP